MTVNRRQALGMGGGLVAAFCLPVAFAHAGAAVEIIMSGRSDGSRVWVDPVGLNIRPGQTVRWVNRDKGNAHTTTAYHPDNFGKPRRIPSAARPWDSDYLLPDESFSVTLTEPGVYDYFCVPHEHAGMVGRIVVGSPRPGDWRGKPQADAGMPEVALRAFPSVEEIMAKGIVRRG